MGLGPALVEYCRRYLEFFRVSIRAVSAFGSIQHAWSPRASLVWSHMPTTNWIIESALDRYWEGTYRPAVQRPPLWSCPYCDDAFEVKSNLDSHVSVHHPVSYPRLLVSRRPATRELTIRRSPDPGDFELVNCNICVAHRSGGSSSRVTPDEIGQWLCEQAEPIVELELRNTPGYGRPSAVTRYVLRFEIPGDELLDAIDGLFIKHLAVPKPTMTDVDRFRLSSPKHRACVEYVGALCDYVVGILLKEQARDRGVLEDFDEFQGKLKSAFSVLGSFPRRLPLAVVTLIAFNLNAWRYVQPPSELVEVARGIAFFRNFLPEGLVRVEVADQAAAGTASVFCPIDEPSHRILTAAGEFLSSGALDPNRLTFDPPLSEYDEVKLRVLRAASALSLGEQKEALGLLRKIQFDQHFKHWAEKEMGRITGHG